LILNISCNMDSVPSCGKKKGFWTLCEVRHHRVRWFHSSKYNPLKKVADVSYL
jgi:hypothetical protein